MRELIASVDASSDGKITYQGTIENLHILDYDYYFKITDALLAEDRSTALLIFDEILKKGFDGNNFLVGLQSHFRDLLVGQKESTVELLEVTGSLKERYLEQGKKASPSFLLSAMNILNQAELGYKMSKNQRLHVELALMKLAHLNQAFTLSSENGAKKKVLS